MDIEHDERQQMALYTLFRTEIHRFYELHLQHARHYVTILTALLGGSFAALNYLEDPPILKSLVLILGGGIGVLIALFGRLICDHYYKKMLEAIATSSKLEQLIGLTRQQTEGVPWCLFPDDPYLIPTRWVENIQGFSTSALFIHKRMNGGSNRVIQLALWVFAILNIVMLFSGVLHMRFMYLLFDNPWMGQ